MNLLCRLVSCHGIIALIVGKHKGEFGLALMLWLKLPVGERRGKEIELPCRSICFIFISYFVTLVRMKTYYHGRIIHICGLKMTILIFFSRVSWILLWSTGQQVQALAFVYESRNANRASVCR